LAVAVRQLEAEEAAGLGFLHSLIAFEALDPSDQA
jgi:hypothetical protein